jgi:hypothetical protein
VIKRPQKPKKPTPLPAKAGQPVHGEITMAQERLIGRTIVSWSKLEAAIDHTMWSFLNLDIGNGRKFTTSMNADRKIGFLRLLAETYLDGEQLSTILDTIDTIDLCRDDRNFIAHGTWFRSGPDKEHLVFSIRVKTNPDDVVAESFPGTRLRELIVKIERSRAVLSRLKKQLDSRE